MDLSHYKISPFGRDDNLIMLHNTRYEQSRDIYTVVQGLLYSFLNLSPAEPISFLLAGDSPVYAGKNKELPLLKGAYRRLLSKERVYAPRNVILILIKK